MTDVLELLDAKMSFRVGRGFFHGTTLTAVDEVSMSLKRGETLALIGESGSGKTTLGRLTLRLLEPTGGKIIFDGKDITHVSEGKLSWFRKAAQTIFQDPYSSLNPAMSVQNILEEPLEIHHLNERKVNEETIFNALKNCGLTPQENFLPKHPHLLSGGQRQRVAIARAIILRPKYIVADEPVSMIDASGRVEILDLLRSLQVSYGISFLYITHDIATTRYSSDRIAVMYLGRIVEVAPAEELIRNPLHPYTVALIGAVPEPDPSNLQRERPSIPGEAPIPIELPPVCRFNLRCPKFMKGTCDKEDPALEEIAPNHFVACHLYS